MIIVFQLTFRKLLVRLRWVTTGLRKFEGDKYPHPPLSCQNDTGCKTSLVL